jgi:hypothetical protein
MPPFLLFARMVPRKMDARSPLPALLQLFTLAGAGPDM